MIKKVLLIILIISILPAYSDNNKSHNKHSKHLYPEKIYQHIWCNAHNGIEEFKNKDYTRVDCLTDNHAVEFDFANKWAESIGQALHYQLMTGKKGKVVLILEKPETEMIYYNKVKNLSRIYKFDTEYITSNIITPQNLAKYSKNKNIKPNNTNYQD